MASPFNIDKAEDIFAIPDAKTGLQILKDWGVSIDGIKAKKVIQELLLNHWKSASEDEHKPVIRSLKEVIATSKRNRDGLIKKYEEMLVLYKQLPANHQSSLDKCFPSLEDTTCRKIKELKSNECAVIVAGESVAGKSSFINLLLRVDILPTSQLSCTATFCELRYSSSKYAICYTKDGRKTKIDLSNTNGLEELKQNMSYVTDDVDDNENEKILVFWPFDILEEGIVIIDTPGIGTSKEMTERIQQYLTQAFGCIYIINSANAGGVQEGRIVDFLRTVMNLSEEQFNPSTTMFICNKWELVPARDKDEVIKRNNYKLRQCYPDFRPDQVYYLSTETAKRALSKEVRLQDYKHVLEGINQLLPASLENKYESYYRWISTVAKRMQFTLKVSKHARNANLENLGSQMQRIENQMTNLRQNAKTSIRHLQKEVENEADGLHNKVINLLSSHDFLSAIKAWDPTHCPTTAKKWKKVSATASELIAHKVTQTINEWERRHGVKAEIKNKIIGRFKKDFELMEDQINDIEGMLLWGETRILADLQKTIKGPKKKRDKMKSKGNTQNWSGIGGVVAVLGTLGKESKNVFKTYKKETGPAKMAEGTDIFIQNIKKSRELKDNLSKFVQRYARGIDRIAELIPDFLKADSQIIADLKQEVEQTYSQFDPIHLETCVRFQGYLDLFYVDYMMHVDYNLSDVEFHWNKRLGSGSFADVFHGVLRTGDGERLEVALKKSIHTIEWSSVTDILLEDRTMRDVKHDNFITYYGNALHREGRKTYWVMIMECCVGSLKDVVVDTDSNLKVTNPGNCTTIGEKNNAVNEMAVYGEQLCNGLAFLHSQKMVHRDLKLENVLLTDEKIVKITDFGLTKPEIDISGSRNGSPVYMAPEVLNSTGVYDRTADIYSLGIMIWEMWYGVDAAAHIGPRIMVKIEKDVAKGLRPSLTRHHKPDELWAKVIEQCWNGDPSRRPTADDVLTFFRNLEG